MWDGWDGKSMNLNHRPLVDYTANKARDSFLLHLALHSLPEDIILWRTSPGIGEANVHLIQNNIAIVLMVCRSWIKESNFRNSHCEGGRRLMDLKEVSFSF